MDDEYEGPSNRCSLAKERLEEIEEFCGSLRVIVEWNKLIRALLSYFRVAVTTFDDSGVTQTLQLLKRLDVC
jgi:hypothetical protein